MALGQQRGVGRGVPSLLVGDRAVHRAATEVRRAPAQSFFGELDEDEAGSVVALLGQALGNEDRAYATRDTL